MLPCTIAINIISNHSLVDCSSYPRALYIFKLDMCSLEITLLTTEMQLSLGWNKADVK